MYFNILNIVYVSYRNRRSAQGDRLTAITMALQAGSESDEDSLLSGNFEASQPFLACTMNSDFFFTLHTVCGCVDFFDLYYYNKMFTKSPNTQFNSTRSFRHA